MAKSVLYTVENIVGKGGNAGCQHFLLFPDFFQKAYFLRVFKSWDCVVKALRYKPMYSRCQSFSNRFDFFFVIDWLNSVLRRFQQYFSHITATAHIIHVFNWVSPVLGWGSEVSYQRTLPHKNPKDPVQFEPRTLDYEPNTLPLSQVGPPYLL